MDSPHLVFGSVKQLVEEICWCVCFFSRETVFLPFPLHSCLGALVKLWQQCASVYRSRLFLPITPYSLWQKALMAQYLNACSEQAHTRILLAICCSCRCASFSELNGFTGECFNSTLASGDLLRNKLFQIMTKSLTSASSVPFRGMQRVD